VQQNSLALQQKLAERQKLMSQLDQAKMQEQLNRAMSSLNQTVDSNAPSLDQVRAKIEARYARAIGTSELTGQTVESRMLEVQQAAMGTEAKSRLETMRAELGLPSTAGELGAGAVTDVESVATSQTAEGQPVEAGPQDEG
jgi:phage shock protein A